MANSSILAAFEKMWEHIVIGFNTKANTDLSNVDDTTFKDKAESAGVGGGIPIVTATSSNGTSYTATVDGVTSLDVGTRITIIPNRNSASTSPTLNVNSLGDYAIQTLVVYNSYTTSAGATTTWLVADTPITLMYNGECWIAVDMPRTSAQYLYGTVSVSSGGTGQTSIADTTYTTARYRASSLHSAETNPTTNGVICWTYE